MIQALAKDREPVVVFDCRILELVLLPSGFRAKQLRSRKVWGCFVFQPCFQRQKEKAARDVRRAAKEL